MKPRDAHSIPVSLLSLEEKQHWGKEPGFMGLWRAKSTVGLSDGARVPPKGPIAAGPEPGRRAHEAAGTLWVPGPPAQPRSRV